MNDNEWLYRDLIVYKHKYKVYINMFTLCINIHCLVEMIFGWFGKTNKNLNEGGNYFQNVCLKVCMKIFSEVAAVMLEFSEQPGLMMNGVN